LPARAGAGQNSVIPPRWSTEQIATSVAARLRRGALVALQRLSFWLDGMARPTFRIPAQPWSAGNARGETVATFPGIFEPARAVAIYGATAAVPIGKRSPRDPNLHLRRYDNVIVLPHHVLLSAETGEILPPTFDLQSSEGTRAVRRLSAGGYKYRPGSFLKAARAATTPVFVADCIFRGYGHSLLEVIPKLAMLDAAPADALVATSGMVLPELYAALGATSARLIRLDCPLFCDVAYVPDSPLDLGGNVHTLARAAFRRLLVLGDASRIDVPDYVYLSRARVPRRGLENEAEIEALFRSRGFAIVQPETLSVADQVKLMTRAQGIAGPGGSAMHNLMFSPPETRALFLLSPHWFVGIDQYVAQADGQFGIVFGTAGHYQQSAHRHLRTWVVDPAVVDGAISQHFGL
jgi:hypothetical protein